MCGLLIAQAWLRAGVAARVDLLHTHYLSGAAAAAGVPRLV